LLCGTSAYGARIVQPWQIRHVVVARAFPFLLVSFLAACSGGAGSTDETVGQDSGRADTAADDTGSDDTGSDDTGTIADTAPPDTAPASCDLRPKCDAPLPDVGPKGSFRHTTSGWGGSANHRGRDLFVKAGSKQWALAKFAYGGGSVAGGIVDNDAQDEDVDVYLLRDCGSTWKKVGTFRTTNDGAHSTEENVIDTGGRIYVDLSTLEPVPLGVGRHRVHFVMKGDLSATDQYIEVLPDSAKVVVTDIDGTLTTSESASFTEAFGLSPPGANPGSAEALTALAKRGYYMLYLTARPEWFVQKTRNWLNDKGFPPGIVHTGFSLIGETGSAAINLKTSELAALKTRTGVVPSYGFGNTDTDAAAYDNAGISPPANRYFFKATGDLKGGTLHDDYSKLVAPFSALPITSCPAK